MEFHLNLPRSFNPCFSGFTSTTQALADLVSVEDHVSILVFLDSLLQRLTVGLLPLTPTWFQSLFFWIHFYNANWMSMMADSPLFQSLFFWIHFYNWANAPAAALVAEGFNPCFSGFTSTTLPDDVWAMPHTCFNPCFSGFTSTTTGCGGLYSRPIGFQSLFFWIHFYNFLRKSPSRLLPISFNPCFSGFTSTTKLMSEGGIDASLVSILVFLDSLLQPHLRSHPLDVDHVFQSLFFWIHFYNDAFVGVGWAQGGVSILVFLDSLLQPRRRSWATIRPGRFQSLFFWIHFYNKTGCTRGLPTR